ncbi:MAG: cobalamin-dependent protein, partial [Muribaculaceae bacterium]|nr:cobalamin-dependent protein [Muribaculaceae bacterium]
GSISGRPLVTLATVKGDVHDIGKNIVAVVLRCGGFNVLDLGVMVDPERIIEEAVKNNASAIGLSGLITPSLHEMCVIAEMMEKKGLSIPLFVGGATTSDLHTAVKIAPLYSGAVVHTKDAASLPGAVKDFTGENFEGKLIELRKAQKKLCDSFHSSTPLLSLTEARKKGRKVRYPAQEPKMKGVFNMTVALKDLVSLINWRAFLSEWKLNPADASLILEGSLNDSESSRLIDDAIKILDSLKGNAKAKVIVTGARSNNDDIILENGTVIPTLRSLTPNPISGNTVAMSDYIYTDGDHLALFAVTLAGSGIPEEILRLKDSDEYRSLLLQSLSHRLAEAATEWIHRHILHEVWGIDEKTGIRPAVGYPSLPDQSLLFTLNEILGYKEMGIEISENGALYPTATTSGLIIAHPDSRYFE